MLDTGRQRFAADFHDEAGPAIVRVERGLVDHARAAGEWLDPPAELAAEPGARDADGEARLRARLEALDPRAVAKQPDPRLGKTRRRRGRPVRCGLLEPKLWEE